MINGSSCEETCFICCCSGVQQERVSTLFLQRTGNDFQIIKVLQCMKLFSSMNEGSDNES